MRLPTWMRMALLATAVMNAAGAATFAPSGTALRALMGLPESEQPLYLAIVCVFVLAFGLAYLWAGVTGEADRLFLTVAAGGKLAFFALLLWFWAAGGLPMRAPLLGSGDLVFGLLFAVWLFGGGRAVRASAAR